MNCIHPDDREYVNKKWGAAIKGEHYDIDHRLMMQDGRVKWVREKAYLDFDNDGNCLSGTGVTQDITIRKQAEDELEKHREHMEELVKERTIELERKNKDLENYNKLFSEREFRIKELRDQVKELEAQINFEKEGPG